jgi:hypothetical protein
MGNPSLLAGSTSAGGGASPADVAHDAAAEGYASDDFVQGSSSANRERKKGDLPKTQSLSHPRLSKTVSFLPPPPHILDPLSSN